uniref:Thioredoxin domain-containing protein 17 n=1 Tax=Glossina austeni TaxID=7395 RepID=A0A1A9VBW8_GLOAU
MSVEKRITSVERHNKHCLTYLASSRKVENWPSLLHATSGSESITLSNKKLHQRASHSSHGSHPLKEDDNNCPNHNNNVQMQLRSPPHVRNHNNPHEALDIQLTTTNRQLTLAAVLAKLSSKFSTKKSMVREELAKGYENFQKATAKLSEDKNVKLYVYFIGDRNANGQNWCKDCNEAEPVYAQAIQEYADKNSIILRVEVGNKLAWADKENPFRKDSDLRLQEIPTLIRWKTALQLRGDQCKQIKLLELRVKLAGVFKKPRRGTSKIIST